MSMDSAPGSSTDRAALRFAMNLSLAVGCLMLVIKMGAYQLTGSAAILSDAAESVVHVVAVAFAAFSLRLSERPPDTTHLYGHAKISFFSAGFEGAMILLAALYIIGSSILKWIRGLELENLGFGAGLTVLATVINGALGGYLLWTGKRRHSIILEANGRHVLTDCYTSLGVVAGLSLTLLTGWLPWDPICAIAVAINILVSGGRLVRQAAIGLMDTADPAVNAQLRALLEEETRARGIQFHGLRHRNIGDAHWVECHLLFPATTTVKAAHAVATEIERVIESSLQPRAHVTTHLETIEDHAELHRGETH